MFGFLKKGRFQSLPFIFLAVFVTGCATYQLKAGDVRRFMREGRYDEAIKILEPLAHKSDKDQLVYLLDYAMVLQQAGRYEDSNRAFLAAGEIAKIQDYTSLTKETASLLLNQGQVQYKGDDYEKLLIHVQLALNFLMQENYDEALVETRALDEMLTKFRVDAKKDYEQNTFARYLSATIWEASKKWDDAYIDYKTVYKQTPGLPLVPKDILRTAMLSRADEELPKWKMEFPKVELDPWWKDKEKGELIFIYMQGRAPVKRPHPESPRFPKLYAVPALAQRAQLAVVEGPTVQTEQVYSVEHIAIKTLDDDYNSLVAKRVAGVVAKAVVAEKLREKNKLLGDLAWIGMNIADQADTRQWSTLPATYQVGRVPLKAGTYRYTIQGLSSSGSPTGESAVENQILIKPGHKSFVLWRSFD